MKKVLLIIGTAVVHIGLIICADKLTHVKRKGALCANTASYPPAPEVRFRDLDGKDVSLSQYKGRVVFVNFWATWCAPGSPEIHEHYSAFVLAERHVLAIEIPEPNFGCRGVGCGICAQGALSFHMRQLVRTDDQAYVHHRGADDQQNFLHQRSLKKNYNWRACSNLPTEREAAYRPPVTRRSNHITTAFKKVSLLESQVSLLKKTKPPKNKSKPPLKTSTAWRYFRKFL